MDDAMDKLKKRLDETHEWPSVYVFKFIMPTVPSVKEEVLALFSENVETSTRMSKNAKYTSITIKEVVMSSDEVLRRYKEASAIEGVMAL